MGIFRNNMEVNKTLAGFPGRFQELLDSVAEALGIQKDQQFTGRQVIAPSDIGSTLAPLDGTAKVSMSHIKTSVLPSPNAIPFPDNDGLLSGWSGLEGNPVLVSSAKADITLPAAGGQVTWTQDPGSDFQIVWPWGLYMPSVGEYCLFVSGNASKVRTNNNDVLTIQVDLTDKFVSWPYTVHSGRTVTFNGQNVCYVEFIIVASMNSGNSLNANVTAKYADNQIHFSGYAVALRL